MDEDENLSTPPSEQPRANAPSLLSVVPRALRSSDRRAAALALTIGMLLGIASAFLCFASASRGSMLRRAFDPSQVQALIPYSILCLFFWALAICFFRWRRLRALAAVSSPALLMQALEALQADDGMAALRGALNQDACLNSPLLRRLQLVLEQWVLSPGLQEAEVVLSNQVVLDNEASARGYSLVRVMVWALPVLGLVGTVLGIADAVRGFANFLGQDVNDVGQIRQKLVEVTGGLSFAFLITLEGLVTSLILMLIVSALQSAEERLFSRVLQSISETFLPALQRVAAPAAKPVSAEESGDELLLKLQEVAATSIRTVERTAEAIVRSMERVTDSSNKAVSAVGQAGGHVVMRQADTAINAIRQERDAWSKDTQAMLQRLTTAFSNLTASLDETTARQKIIVDRVDKMQGAQALEELRSAINQLTPVLAQFRQPFVLQAVSAPPRQ